MVAYQSEQSLISDTLRYRLPNGEDKERLIGMSKEIYGYIYMVKNLVNGKLYFGITVNDFDTRYNGNITKYTHNDHLRNSINTYGIENFEINEEFDIAYTEDDLWDLEDMYICLYNTLDEHYGYNKRRSGSKRKGCGKMSEESKKKMSESSMGEKNPMYGVSPKERMDEETYKQWLHKQQTMNRYGEANPNYGNTWDDEQRERQSRIQKEIAQRDDYVNPFKGKHHSEETKQKYFYGEANPMFGKTWSEESKMYTKKEGYVNPFKGKHHTEEAKEKNRKAHLGKGCVPVICLNTMQVFNSIKDASETMNISDSLAKHCKGKQKSCGSLNGEPLVWMYYKDYIALDEEEREQFRINKLEQAQPKNKYGQNKRPVICLETKEVYESCAYVRNNLKMDVQKCCRGITKTCGGYHWMYYEDYLKLQEQN